VTELYGAEYNAVLFDLDGTLIDTAPDMVTVLQHLQQEHGVEPAPYDLARSFVSNGAIGLLTLGFPEIEIEFGDELHQQYLERYAEMICQESQIFDGLDRLLDQLDDLDCPWGIVTNKPEQLTEPLLIALGLAERSSCIVSGDTLSVRKPDPAPLLLGCDLLGVDAATSIYIGDAERDIEAGRRAGMATIAAGYGYITPDDDPREWDANVIATTTEELTQIVLKAVNLDA
jgi:N-acetyl-D-muramate 6-phosphate phosphatase